MAIVVIDSKGRILIPKNIREAVGATTGTAFIARVEENKIILEKIGKPSEKYAGIFKPRKKVPEDLDKVVLEAIEEWWRERGNM